MNKTVTSQENQSVFDLSIQIYGSIEAAFDLMDDNTAFIADLTTPIQPGSILLSNREAKDAEMAMYYASSSLLPANGITATGVVPPPVFSGDFNNDYNNDYFNS